MMGQCVIYFGVILKVNITPIVIAINYNNEKLIHLIAILDTQGWGVSPRGAGYLFGSDVVAQFNAANDIDMICRFVKLVFLLIKIIDLNTQFLKIYKFVLGRINWLWKDINGILMKPY